MKITIGVVGLVAAMQLVRCEQTNPPVTGDIGDGVAPDEVKTLLRRACYDCHSNETVWPLYSQIAPASWLVHHDVTDGRKHLNFSVWNSYAAKKQAHKLDETVDEIQKGDMPPWFYLPLHPAAKLTEAEKQRLVEWAKAAAAAAEKLAVE